MSMVLEYTIRFIIYLVGGFAGVWLSNLMLGIDANPFTSILPYIIALGMLMFTIKEELKWN